MLNDDSAQTSAATDAEPAGPPATSTTSASGQGLRSALRRRTTPRRGIGLLAGLGVTVVGMLVVAATVLAVHNITFQLDGDTSTLDIAPISGVTRTLDWDSLFTNTGTAVSPLPAGFKGTTEQPAGTGHVIDDYRIAATGKFDTSDGTTYTSGSKDILDINGWSCVGANNVTNKGDIINAYAAQFKDPTSHDNILYFGMNKYVPQGSNNVGIWFLQDKTVACPPDSTGNGVKFTGAHQQGDLFVVVSWSGNAGSSGQVNSVAVYHWDTTLGLVSEPSVPASVDCRSLPSTSPTDTVCAAANGAPITIKWPHASTSDGSQGNAGASATIPAATFFEGGIDLSQFQAFAGKCFTKVLFDTRSAPTTTATLYDYALGDLNTCGTVTVKKVTIPSPATATFSYTTTGGAPLGGGFQLDTNPATTTPTDTKIFPNVNPGNYSVTETALPSGWARSNLVCTKNGAPFSGNDTTVTSTGVASFAVDVADDVFCTYTNVQPKAKIAIGADSTNQVNHEHTFTVTVSKDLQDGNSYVPASGVTVTGAKVSGVGTITGGTCTTGNTGANGTCTLIVNSSVIGSGVFGASATVSVLGVNIPVSTNSTGDNSGPATKTWVDARISIGTSGTNEVNHAHTFTILVEKNDGTGWTPATGVTVTSAEVGVGTITGGTCGTTGPTDGTGHCTVIVNSAVAGTDTVNATATVTVGGVPIGVDTNGYGAFSISNVKTFVDAYITIGPPLATNTVGDPHTFTVTVFQNNGDGTGFHVATVGNVDVTLANTLGATFALDATSSTCDDNQPLGDNLDANGQCVTVFTSPTAGTVTGHATVTLVVGGVTLTRATDGAAPNSGDAVKNFVAGSIKWTKVDNAGALQGGATFSVCKTATFTLPAGPFVAILPADVVCTTVLDNTAPDADPANGKFELDGLALGRYTVHETIAPAGFVPDPGTATVELQPGSTDAVIATAFVNSRPILKISGFGYTNVATGTPTHGVTSGTSVFSVNLHNYGTANAVLSNSSLVITVTGAGAGTVVCGAGSTPTPFTLPLTGTIIPTGDLGPVNLSCTYSNMNDGAVITATLVVKYTTNNLERQASGSPATISFTVQAD